MKYIAHKKEDGTVQTIQQHCCNVADMAASFARPLGLQDIAYTAGLVHDLGKYSASFQRRIKEDGVKVDHESAGAQVISKEKGSNLMKYMIEEAVASHHSGLLDTGSIVANDHDGTLAWRLSKTVDDFSAYKNEISIPDIKTDRFHLPDNNDKYTWLYVSFMTRMLFSCLVDADFLDTEAFVSPISRTNDSDSIPVLCSRLMEWLTKKGWRTNIEGLAGARSKILNDCIDAANKPKGLYTLTVPTGGGKTVSSLAFALNHAKLHHLSRIIYVIPYCSIIDQTVQIFRNILGSNNVLAHYSEADYSDSDNKHVEMMRLASENWDMPVIVTTAAQFFESMYSCKTSKCRKLHNIANSVIVFDEAQTFPIPYLDPCVAAISQVVTNCGSTCVLCTATQPALSNKLETLDNSIHSEELCPDAARMQQVFKRVTYKYIGRKNNNDLLGLLQNEPEVLCIVSTVRQAYDLYQDLKESGSIYCLSTNMLPSDRKLTLNRVKKALKAKEKCILISTSMIEAGVDIDFPVVYRSYAGIDAMIQAGGRCNREGKRPLAQSIVYLFEPEQKYRLPADMLRPKEEAEPYKNKDITDSAVEEAYFTQLYNDSCCDEKGIIDLLNKKAIAFQTASKQFHLIENNTWTLYIPIDEVSSALISKMQDHSQFLTRQDYRTLGKYALSIYDTRLKKIIDSVCILDPDNKIAVLANTELYQYDCGLSFESLEGGMIMF